MRELTQTIIESFDRGQDVVLASIMDQSGSAPRTSGAAMIITREGGITGTIGGGQLEARVIEAAAGVFENPGLQRLDLDLSGQLGDALDMICGGRVTVLLEYLKADGILQCVYADLLAAIKAGRSCFLATMLPAGANMPGSPKKGLFSPTQFLSGHDTLARFVTPDLLKSVARARRPMVMHRHDRDILITPFMALGRVILFGGGHVSLETARLLQHLGFKISVVDDREEFSNPDRFPMADEILVSKGFDDCFARLKIDAGTYVVILTRGHRFDATVLEAVLSTPAGYIGMIGSTRKRDAIYRELMEKGILEKDLQNVHCPVGLAIGAETPQEIAVSIAAQLIAARAARLKPA